MKFDKQAFEFLVSTTTKTLGISELAARLRIQALFKSGILERFTSPDDPLFQYTVDMGVHIPQIGNEGAEFN